MYTNKKPLSLLLISGISIALSGCGHGHKGEQTQSATTKYVAPSQTPLPKLSGNALDNLNPKNLNKPKDN
ncbi:hypothetical protein HAP94_01720 [Acidithiobacillus ferrivorans]|nr:hypothetical protein [Acidithiobacillus ferrivorans]